MEIDRYTQRAIDRIYEDLAHQKLPEDDPYVIYQRARLEELYRSCDPEYRPRNGHPTESLTKESSTHE
jgi:hypothetical protein